MNFHDKMCISSRCADRRAENVAKNRGEIRFCQNAHRGRNKVFRPEYSPLHETYILFLIEAHVRFWDSFLEFQAQECKRYSILMTLKDVSSLYTNIDQEEGAAACFRKLEERKKKDIPSSLLKKLILLVLRCNIFRFGESLFSQRKGTCMGTPMAPNYANLFMNEFEQNLLNDYYKKTGKRPLVWWRYIDDIFCILHLDRWGEKFA